MTALLVQFLNRLFLSLELMAAGILFGKHLSPRKAWGARLLLCLVIAVGVNALYPLLKNLMMAGLGNDFSRQLFWRSYFLNVAYEILAILLCALMVAVVFETGASTVLFIISAAFSMQSICNNILSLLQAPEWGQFTVQHLTDPVCLLAFLAVYILVYGLCYRFLIRKYVDWDEDRLRSNITLIAVCISVINIILGGVETPHNSNQASQLFLFMVTARLLLGILGLVVLFYFLKWTKMQFEYEKQEYIAQQQRQQYEVARESVNMVNINAHDLRGQIAVLKEAIRVSGRTSAIHDELVQMERYVDSVDTCYRTGNSALDVVLTEKARSCKAKAIQFSAIVDGSALETISDVDIYVFFGNALDNAIEAAAAVEDPQGRIISLCLRRDPCGVVIHVENTFALPPRFDGDLPLTHKEGPFHGYGTKSMMRVAEKYSGHLTLWAGDELFYLDCYIPPKNT